MRFIPHILGQREQLFGLLSAPVFQQIERERLEIAERERWQLQRNRAGQSLTRALERAGPNRLAG